MNKRLYGLVVAAALLGGAASADPAKLYRWTDSDGHVHYSDRVPPEAARQQHEQIDAHGKATKTVEREKTPEEYAAEQQKRRDVENQEQHDRFLIATYATREDLIRARDQQLHGIDEREAAAQKTLERTNATLADLKSRHVDADSDDPDAKSKLAKEIETFEGAARETGDVITKLHTERRETGGRFEADLARYEILRPPTATIPPVSKTP